MKYQLRLQFSVKDMTKFIFTSRLRLRLRFRSRFRLRLRLRFRFRFRLRFSQSVMYMYGVLASRVNVCHVKLILE